MIKTSGRPFFIILCTFVLTFVAGLIYLFYLIKTVPDSASIGIPFGFAAFVGLGLFIECIIFLILFYRHFRQIWFILLPTFLVTSIIPIYSLSKRYENRPVKIPLAGKLSVPIEQYNMDSKLVLEDYDAYDLDSNKMDIYQKIIISSSIDTIIYNRANSIFFAIIINVIKDTSKYIYGNEYRVGRRIGNKWELGEPQGNILSSRFETAAQLKNDLRQYFYKKYSINSSSDKPEIWNDEYIFSFATPREKYIDRKKNAL